MAEMGLDPQNKADRMKFWNQVDRRKLEKMIRELDDKFKNDWLKTGAKRADFAKLDKLRKNVGYVASIRIKGHNALAALKLSAKVVAVLALFEDVAFAANLLTNEPPDAMAVREEFIASYRQIVGTAAENGQPPTRNEMDNLATIFDRWMGEVKVKADLRGAIRNRMTKLIIEEFENR